MNIKTGVLIGLLSSPVMADTYIDLHVTSWHSKDTYTKQGVTKQYNNKNFGLGVTKSINLYNDVSAGFFKNSYYDMSTYIGIDTHTNTNPRIGVIYGVVTGYDQGYVLAMPNVTYDVDRYRVRFGLIPGSEVQALTLTVSYKF